jgi:hypothetical protein
MATGTTVNNTGNQLTTNYDFSEVLLGNNTFEKATLVNLSGALESLSIGTVLGRVSASGNVTLCVSTATDGSQHPFAVLASSTTAVAIAGTAAVSICDFGDVALEKLTFGGADTINTVLAGRRFLDLIPSNSRGIKLISSTDLTGFDNN